MKTLLAALALTAVSLTGCTPATTPEIIDAVTTIAPTVEVGVNGEASTLEAEVKVGVNGAATGQDAGGPVEEIR